MSRKIQQQFLFSKLRDEPNNRRQFPIKITQKKIEKVNLNLNLNNSFTKEFTSMQKENSDEDENNNLLAQSYNFNQINKYREKILNEPSTIILESKIYSQENGGRKNFQKKMKFITPQDASGIFEKLLNQNKESKDEYLKLRNINQSENEIRNFLIDKLNQRNLQKLYSTISNLNYKINMYLISNNINPLFSLKLLFEEINLTNVNINNIRLNYNEKYNKLSPIIYRCRKIKGDGNCYYRAVMFRYFEQIILSKNIILLKKIILEMNQAFKSKEIQDRLYITMNVNFKPELHLNIMYLILNLLEEGKTKESYELYIKCVLSCAVFDYGLILYFRYILYLYIKDNEKKLYSENFPVKVGNFLPSKYENENGEFEFQKFYTNYLLKMFTEAEKIIIYLTPFVLGINLDIIIFEDNEAQIVKRFSYEEENGESKLKDNVITLLNRNAHYELVYTYNEYNKYSEFYKNCEIFEDNNNNNNNDILGNSLGDSNFFLFQSNNKEYKKEKENRTMIFQQKNKNAFNNSSKIRTFLVPKRHVNNYNTHSNNLNNIYSKDNGSRIQKNNPIKIINQDNKTNNLTNKDNNEINKETNEIKEVKEKNEIKGIKNEIKKIIEIKGIKNEIKEIKKTNVINESNKKKEIKEINKKNVINETNKKYEIKEIKNDIKEINKINEIKEINNDFKEINKKNEFKEIKNEIKDIELNNNKQKIKLKNKNEIPFGHPEYKSDNFDSYLDEIDNMFLNNKKFFECLNCKKRVIDAIQTDYELCDECLKNKVIILLANDYSNYLKTENIKIKKYKITKSIKLYKYDLYLKNILDILKIYLDISKETDLYQYIKQFVCIYCLKVIDIKKNSKVIFPCGCAVCNKDELEKFFTEQNILSEDYQCLCEYKYQPKDLYTLAEKCKKAGSESICFLIINIFHKYILYRGCCGCGSKQKDIQIKYKIIKSNSDEFFFEDYLNSLAHFFCKNCDNKYKNQQFICYYCNKIHVYLAK